MTEELNFTNEATDVESSLLADFGSDVSPKESIQNIDRANYYEVSPDTYVESKTDLDKSYELDKRTPAQVHDSVKMYQGQGPEFANSVEEDVGVFSKMGNIFDHMVYNQSGRDELDERITKFANMDVSGELNEEGQLAFDKALAKRDEAEAQFSDLGVWEAAPGNVTKVLNDMVGGIWDHKGKIAAATATSAGAAALVGTVTLPVVGTIAGASGGAAFGLTAAMTAALGAQAYEQTVNDTWIMLRSGVKDSEGNDVNLSREQKLYIARAVGATAGGLELITGAVLGKTITKVAMKSAIAQFINNPAKRVALNSVGAMMTAGGVSGAEEVAAEIASIAGEVYAKNINKSGVETIDDFFETLGKPETLKRLYETGVTGVLAGGTIPGVAAGVTTRRNIRSIKQTNIKVEKLAKKFKVPKEQLGELLTNYEAQSNALKQVDELLTVKKSIDAITQLSKETQLEQLSPEQAKEMKKQIVQDAGIKDLHLSQNDMDIIEANNPELSEKIRDLDVSMSSLEETNSGAVVNPEDFIELVKDAPSLAEFMRLHPEGPNALESNAVLERLEQAEIERARIYENLQVNNELSDADLATLNRLNEDIKSEVDNLGQKGYEEGAKPFTEDVQAALGDEKTESYKKAQVETRKEVSGLIEEKFLQDEQRIENRVVRANEKIQKELDLKKDGEEIRILSLFKHDKKAPSIEGHKKKGFSKFAIDPKYLPDNLREAYTTDPKLKKSKIFVEGGMTPAESAALVGVESWQDMLRIVANSKSAKERLQSRKKKSKELRKQVQEVRGKSLNERLDKTFDNDNKLHLKEMKVMREKKWPATKQGINFVTLPLPQMETIKNSAKNIIRKTKVGKLNTRQFNQGAKANQKKANGSILNNKPNEAFQAKEKVILNNELTRESIKINDKIKHARNFVSKKLLSKQNIANLKKSGVLKQVNEIVDLFNLNENKAQAGRQETYTAHLKRLESEGKTVVIPESFNDIRERGDNLTTEQFLRITERLQTLNHLSKHKNKLIRMQDKIEGRKQVETEESLVLGLDEDLKAHPDYNENRTKTVRNKNSKDFKDNFLEGVGYINGSLTNAKNVVTQMDKEALQGKHYESLIEPLVKGETKKRLIIDKVMKQIKKISEDYGNENFNKAFTELIDIPEFAGYAGLGNGKMLKSDLWTLLMYKGDPDHSGKLTNFTDAKGNTISLDTINAVLENYLTESDAKTAQNFTNIFKNFEQESFELHKRTTGIEPNMVKGIPVVHKDKVHDGGYVPGNFLKTAIDDKFNRYIEIMGDKISGLFGGKEDGKLYSKLRAAEQTEQGRFVERTKTTKRELDTDFMNIIHAYEETAHDLSYREAGMDALKLLKNPVYSKSIISTVGQAKYDVIVDSVIETVGKDITIELDAETVSTYKKLYGHIYTGAVVGLLGFNPTSIAMQPLSLGAATLRMGKKGKRYVGASLATTLKSLGTGQYQELWDRAIDINSDIRLGMDSIDDSMVSSMDDVISKSGNKFIKVRDWMTKTSLLGLKHADIHIKIAVTNAAYDQFVRGDVKNFNVDKLKTMTADQVNAKAKRYAKQIADLALTTSATIDKSRIEKMTQLRIFTAFYTDVRSQLNTGFSEFRKIKNAVKTKNYGEASRVAISLYTMNILTNLYKDTLYDDKDNPLKNLGDIEDAGDALNMLGGLALYGVESTITAPLTSAPLARDVAFSLGGFRRKKESRTLAGKFFGDIATGIMGVRALINGDSLTRHEKQAMWYSTAYAIGGGIPIGGPKKIMKFLDFDPSEDFSLLFGDVVEDTVRSLEDMKTNAKPEKRKMIDGVLDEIQERLPTNVEVKIPEDALEKLAIAKVDELDPETGAAGKYQFTEKMWNDLAEKYPDLELTEDGRTSIQDTEEQEIAMYQLMEDNAEFLSSYEIEVTNETLYGSHEFGVEEYAMVLLSKTSEKLTDVVVDMELFKGFKTVGAVKNHVTEKVKSTK